MTSANGTKAAHTNGPLNGSILPTGRNRKGAGRKDSNTKRKPSVGEDHLGLETATLGSAAGPLESIPPGAVIGGGPHGGTGQGLAARIPINSNNGSNTNGNGVHATVNGVSHPLQNIPGKTMEGTSMFLGGVPQPQGPVLAGQMGVYATAVDPVGLPNGQGFVNLAGQAQSHGGQQIFVSGPGIGLGLGLGMQPQLQQYQQQQQQQQQHVSMGQAGAASVLPMDGNAGSNATG
ncbi:hypothetical protein BGZ67_008173 [Mortierella alpina]|nr:hypothetical protein BGZ67_008173 [Mortierella alpina]